MEGLGEEAGLGLSGTDCHLQGQLALSSGPVGNKWTSLVKVQENFAACICQHGPKF